MATSNDTESDPGDEQGRFPRLTDATLTHRPLLGQAGRGDQKSVLDAAWLLLKVPSWKRLTASSHMHDCGHVIRGLDRK